MAQRARKGLLKDAGKHLVLPFSPTIACRFGQNFDLALNLDKSSCSVDRRLKRAVPLWWK